MSEENSEVDDLDDISTSNIEMASASSICSLPSHVCELGNNTVFSQTVHIVHQLQQREIGLSSNKKMQIHPPLKTLSLFRVFPPKILRGQIFMGMTRCGKFLMTYSSDWVPLEEEWYGCAYHYRLHWWTIPGDGPACEVGSVALFGGARITTPLHISICQWPKINNKVLVYGLLRGNSTVEMGAGPPNDRAFVTVTAIPSANKCVKCNAAKDFEDVDSTYGNKMSDKCIFHSFTAHTSFDISVPYPVFLPRINLKFEDYAVFNTNNVLHALRISVDTGQTFADFEPETKEEIELFVQVPPSPTPCAAPSQLQEQIMRDFADDSSLTPRRIDDPTLSCLSPPMPTRLKTFPDSERPSTALATHEFITPRVFLKVKRCGLKRVGFRPFFSRRKGALGMFLESHTRKSSPYEFVDDSQSEVEQLSQFRRKRLAEKTYEFQDCDSENIVPFSLARLGPGRYPSKLQVLRPLNRNTPPRTKTPKSYEVMCEGKSLRPSSPPPRVRLTDNDILIHDISGRFDLESEDTTRLQTGLRRLAHCFRGTAANVTRRFYENDEERTSAVTDVEDEVGSAATGYHTLLNLEVHGAGYTQLNMTASKSSGNCVRVEQQSLDIEAICQSVATSLCLVADKTFTFCSDYDVEVLDICPNSGDVVVLLMMRIEAGDGSNECSVVDQYETSVTLLWNLLTGDYRITMVVPPQKTKWAFHDVNTWNPAKEASRRFRVNLPADVTDAYPAVRLCSNISYFRDVMSVCSDDTDVLVLCPPDLFTVPDDPETLLASIRGSNYSIFEENVNDDLLIMNEERMRRYGSTDTLMPSARTSLRSRSLHTTPKKNLLNSDTYINQRVRDTECLREIDEYFKGRENNGLPDPSIPSLDLPQVNDFISQLEETERTLTVNSKSKEIMDTGEKHNSAKSIDDVRRLLNFENPLDGQKTSHSMSIASVDIHPMNMQLSIETSEHAMQKDNLLSLHNLWSSQINSSKLSTYEEMKVVKQRLEEERLRRIHCEDLIRDLQNNLLESQEKMAVALKVDEEKDAAINKLKDGWLRAVEKWKELDLKNKELSKNISDLNEMYNNEKESLKASLKKYEQDLLKALNLVHDYNQDQKCSAKERETIAGELTKTQERLNMSEQLNKQLNEKLMEKEEVFKKNTARIDELTTLCKDFKKQMKHYHDEKVQLVQEQEEKLSLLKKIDELSKKEVILEDQLRSVNKSKGDLKLYYQDQVENIVLVKQKDFQLQLANSEKNLYKQFENKEKSIIETVLLEKQQLSEKYKLEILVMEETHREEIELYKMKIGHCNSKIEDLQTMLSSQSDREHDLAEKLHSVIQTQWKETLKVISSASSSNTEVCNGNSPKKPILKRQNTFTKGDNALAVPSSDRISSSTSKKTGSQTYRINETPQKIPMQNSVKELLNQIRQHKEIDPDESNSRLEGSTISNINDTSVTSKEKLGSLKPEKIPWK